MAERVVAVHLDLKGVPPTFERLLSLLPVFVAAGFNAILVEWEDMFPWGDARFRCETAYSAEEVSAFHEAAGKAGLEIIPLVQCLGHMETPLGVAGFEHLREVGHRSDVLNPLAKGALELVEGMVNDVVLARSPKGLRYFHLGGDEAWTFGTHAETKAFIEREGKGALYLQHVEPLLEMLKGKGIRPILWHDMMIHWEPAALDRIAGQADLCVWGYRGTHAKTTSHWATKYMDLFKKHGIKMWGATAYKGAEDQNEDLPDPELRRENCQAWREASEKYGMVGTVATAWSRFSVDRVQDSPIDSCLDVMVMCGRILRDGEAPSLKECEAVLFKIGEGPVLAKCRDAMKDLAEARKNFWRNLQYLREGIVTSTMDARRRGSGNLVQAFLRMRKDYRAALDAGKKMRAAFEGLVESIWIERYFAERVGAMAEEVGALGARVEQLDPVGYGAEVREGAQ